jgi:hypothetical protein
MATQVLVVVATARSIRERVSRLESVSGSPRFRSGARQSMEVESE